MTGAAISSTAHSAGASEELAGSKPCKALRFVCAGHELHQPKEPLRLLWLGCGPAGGGMGFQVVCGRCSNVIHSLQSCCL